MVNSKPILIFFTVLSLTQPSAYAFEACATPGPLQRLVDHFTIAPETPYTDLAAKKTATITAKMLAELFLNPHLSEAEKVLKAKQGFLYRTYKNSLDTAEASPESVEFLMTRLARTKPPITYSVQGSGVLIDKKFDNRDHSTEATRYSILVKSAANGVPFFLSAICTQTFNCLNSADHRSPQCYINAESPNKN